MYGFLLKILVCQTGAEQKNSRNGVTAPGKMH